MLQDVSFDIKALDGFGVEEDCKLEMAKSKNEIKLKVKQLPCGCKPTGALVVRTFDDGVVVWGYACKCGKTFKEVGGWIDYSKKGKKDLRAERR